MSRKVFFDLCATSLWRRWLLMVVSYDQWCCLTFGHLTLQDCLIWKKRTCSSIKLMYTIFCFPFESDIFASSLKVARTSFYYITTVHYDLLFADTKATLTLTYHFIVTIDRASMQENLNSSIQEYFTQHLTRLPQFFFNNIISYIMQ